MVDLKYVSDEKLLKAVEQRFGEQAKFFTEQIRLSKKSPHGRRYSKELKEFSLRQQFQSPLGYRSLGKTFIVPSKSTLYRMINDIPSDPGFNSYVFEKLKEISKKLSDMEKCCVLTLDEMTISQFLSYNVKKDFVVGFHDTENKRRNVAAGLLWYLWLAELQRTGSNH